MRLKSYLLCFIFLFFPLTAVSDNEDSSQLQEGQGYLLVELGFENVTPIVYIAKNKLPRGFRKPKQFKLDSSNERFKLIAIKKGLYQISQIDLAHYNLPFELGTNSTPEWKFEIKANSLNYIGRLEVGREHALDSASAYLINNYASTLDAIRVELADKIKTLPLLHANSYRDDFLPEFLGTPSDGAQE